MEIRPVGNIDFEILFKAFNQAFADYEFQLDKAGLKAMLKRRGFSPDLSFVAFEGNEIIFFVFNGVEIFNGI